MTDGKLTPEQVENWRRVLFWMIGPYALIASDEQIQKIRDAMQERVNTMEREQEGLE